jgi:hypothetical protein
MKNSLSVFLLSFIFCLSGLAAEVTQVKGAKALINLSGTDAQVGQQFFVLSSQGKKIGIIEVKQVKGGKAIAEILKGRAEVGGNLTPKGAGVAQAQKAERQDSAQSESSEETTTTKSRSKKKLSGIGLLFGVGSHSFAMDIGPTTAGAGRDAGKLSGMSFSLKGFGDYDMSPTLTFRGAAGLETFTAKGSITNTYCAAGTSADCSIDFSYLGLEGSAHYNYLSGKTRAWIGIGFSFLVEMSAKNNIPNLGTSGGTNQMLLFSTGVDIPLAKGRFIPLAAEYGMFLGGSDVKANSIFLRAGYGFPF